MPPSKKLSREELEALFEECREEIRTGKKCASAEEVASEKGWMDPVDLALSTDIAHHLAGKNMEILAMEIEEELKEIGISKIERKAMVESLYGYSLIHKKEDLTVGRYLRWITVPKTASSSSDSDSETVATDLTIGEYSLTNGAFLVGIQKKSGAKRSWNLLFKNWKAQFNKIAFRPGMIFQQLNRDEIMVMLLSANLYS
jgi:hypothetical protein